jgi:non-ribosomal peptide synthetase component F
VERVQPERSLSHSPLVQVMFAWQNVRRGRLELAGLTLAAAGPTEHGTAMFDLSLSLQESGGRIVGELEYSTALFERPTVERYLGYLRTLVEAMVKDDRQTVDRLPLMGAEERREVLEDGDDEVEISL